MAHSANRQQQTNNKESGTIAPHDTEWRILAQEAAHENDPQKLIEVIEALNRAQRAGTAQARTAVRTTEEEFCPDGRIESGRTAVNRQT